MRHCRIGLLRRIVCLILLRVHLLWRRRRVGLIWRGRKHLLLLICWLPLRIGRLRRRIDRLLLLLVLWRIGGLLLLLLLLLLLWKLQVRTSNLLLWIVRCCILLLRLRLRLRLGEVTGLTRRLDSMLNVKGLRCLQRWRVHWHLRSWLVHRVNLLLILLRRRRKRLSNHVDWLLCGCRESHWHGRRGTALAERFMNLHDTNSYPVNFGPNMDGSTSVIQIEPVFRV